MDKNQKISFFTDLFAFLPKILFNCKKRDPDLSTMRWQTSRDDQVLIYMLIISRLQSRNEIRLGFNRHSVR